MKHPPEIHNIIVMSTCYITEDTANYLSQNKYPEDEDGFFLWNPYYYEEYRNMDYSENLKDIFNLATKHNCVYIRLHSAGPDIYDELKTYEW